MKDCMADRAATCMTASDAEVFGMILDFYDDVNLPFVLPGEEEVETWVAEQYGRRNR